MKLAQSIAIFIVFICDSSKIREVLFITHTPIMTETKPNIVVISSSDVEPNTIIQQLANCAKIVAVNDAKDLYTWNIDTKYYTAEVNVRGVTKDEESADLNDNIEAIVIHFDSNKDSGLDDLMKWQMFVSSHQPEIKILVTDVFNEDTKITKRHAIGWCLQNGFELIELNPQKLDEPTELASDEESEEEEIIKETKGVERVIEALETHMWSNLIMKSKATVGADDEHAPADPENTSSIDKMLDNLMLDDDELDFGDMFQKLHMVKESVQTMSMRERRHCAEQVVSAFWRAIGGDDDELAES